MLLIFQSLKEPKYLVLAVVFGILIMGFYTFLQVFQQGLNNFWFWFSILTPLGWVLYLLYGSLFGAALSFFIWQRVKRVFPARKIARGGVLGFLGSFLGTTAPVCPGCLPWATLLFPTAFASVLLKYNSLFMALSIVLLIFALWLVGGFVKYEQRRI